MRQDHPSVSEKTRDRERTHYPPGLLFGVGLFIIIAATGIIIFTALYLTKPTLDVQQTFVLYFKGSLAGLHIGSPVNYRGIKVGQVTDIKVEVNRAIKDTPSALQVPVYIQLLYSRAPETKRIQFIRQLISDGLRARIRTTNLLSGDASIDLTFAPDVKPIYHEVKFPLIEIPTIAVREQSIKIDETIDTAKKTLKTIDAFFDNPDLKQAIRSVHQTFTHANHTLGGVDHTLGGVDHTLGGVDRTLSTGRGLLKSINRQLLPVSAHLNDTLTETGRAAYEVGNLASYLERHPSSILVGKGRPRSSSLRQRHLHRQPQDHDLTAERER